MSLITVTQKAKTLTGFDAELVINSTAFPIRVKLGVRVIESDKYTQCMLG